MVMDRGQVARVSIAMNASLDRVWDAFVNPTIIKQYTFGTDVVSDWKEGSAITWKGEWQGKKYEDKGTILWLKPRQVISYSHFSTLSGLPDLPENYHTVTVELSQSKNGTLVKLTQDNNPDDEARKQSEEIWTMMLGSLKKIVEK